MILLSDVLKNNEKIRRMTAEERIQYALDEMARAEQFREDRSYILDYCKNRRMLHNEGNDGIEIQYDH